MVNMGGSVYEEKSKMGSGRLCIGLYYNDRAAFWRSSARECREHGRLYNHKRTDYECAGHRQRRGDIKVYIPDGVTATVTGTLHIRGTVTFSGGGQLIRNESFTEGPMIYIENNAVLNLGTDVNEDGVAINGNNIPVGGHNGGGIYMGGGTLNLCSVTHILRHVTVDGSGGGIAAAGGTINMYNGVIEYNKAQVSGNGQGGGGIYLTGSKDGTVMNMFGGSIFYNETAGAGGGVLVDGSGTNGHYTDFNMSGGLISDNVAAKHGGGIEVRRNAKLSMSGGKVRRNLDGKDSLYESGAGVYLNASTRGFELSGWAEINENHVNNTNEPSNVLIYGTGDLKLTGDLTGSVGVHNHQISLNVAGEQFGLNGGHYSGSENFFCDGNTFVGNTSPYGLVWSDGIMLSDPVKNGFDEPVEGAPLSVTLPEMETAVYQWYASSSGNLESQEDWQSIPGAVRSEYIPGSTDIGRYLICEIRGAGGYTGVKRVVTALAVAASEVEKEVVLVRLDSSGCDGYYNGKERVPKVSFDGEQVPADGDYILTYTGREGTAYNSTVPPVKAGAYSVRLSLTKQGAQRYQLNAESTVQSDFVIEAYCPDQQAFIENEPGNGWFHSDTITLVAPEGFTVSAEDGPDEQNWSSSMTVTISEGAGQTAGYYLKNNETGAISEEKELHFNVDMTAPSGSIQIGGEVYEDYLENPVFELFLKDQSQLHVMITGNDSGSGVVKTAYQKVSSPDLYSPLGPWTEASEFVVVPNEKFIVYVQITDGAGNVTVIHSPGVVLYTGSEIKTPDISIRQESGSNAAVELALNGNTVGLVMNGAQVLTEGTDFIVDGGSLILKGSYLDGLAAGNQPYDFSVRIDPMGESGFSQQPGDASAWLHFGVHVHKKEQAVPPFFGNHKELINKVGDTVKLPSVSGGEGTGAYVYRSSDPSVVQVDSQTGETKVVGVGTAEIYVKKTEDDTYGPSSEDSVTIRVNGVAEGNEYTLPSGGKIQIPAGQEFVNEGKLIIEGELVVDGKLINRGQLVIENRVENNGMIVNEQNGGIENNGSLVNGGIIVNTGEVDNEGQIENGEDGILDNQNEFINNGTLDNEGAGKQPATGDRSAAGVIWSLFLSAGVMVCFIRRKKQIYG